MPESVLRLGVAGLLDAKAATILSQAIDAGGGGGGVKVIQVQSGADPVVIDPLDPTYAGASAIIVAVKTGGTEDVERIYIQPGAAMFPFPTPDPLPDATVKSSYGNYAGRFNVYVVIVTMTSDSDIPVVISNSFGSALPYDGDEIRAFDAAGVTIAIHGNTYGGDVPPNAIPIDYDPAAVRLTWVAEWGWAWDDPDGDNDSSPTSHVNYVPDTSGNPTGSDAPYSLVGSRSGPQWAGSVPNAPGGGITVGLSSSTPTLLPGVWYTVIAGTDGMNLPCIAQLPMPNAENDGGQILVVQMQMGFGGVTDTLEVDLSNGGAYSVVAKDGSALTSITMDASNQYIVLENLSPSLASPTWRLVYASTGVAVVGTSPTITAHTGTAAPTIRGSDSAFEITYGAGSTTDITITLSEVQPLVPIPTFATSLGGITPSVITNDGTTLKLGNLGALGTGKLYVNLAQPSF